MVTIEPRTVVIDVAQKWAVDAAFFLAMGAGFMLWGLIARSASQTILTWAIMAIVAILVDRLIPLLPGTAGLAETHDPPPDGAVHRTVARYIVGAAGATTVLTAVYVALVVYAAPPGFMAGWLTAYAVSRLRAVYAARAIERASGVRLSARVQRSLWRAKPQAYYATPR